MGNQQTEQQIKMRWIRALARCCFVWFVVVVVAVKGEQGNGDSHQNDDPGQFAIAAYLPDYRFYIDLNKTAPHLTDLMLFSLELPKSTSSSSPPSIKEDDVCCLDKDKFRIAAQAVAYKKEQAITRTGLSSSSSSTLNLWLTVGGGGRSDGFVENRPRAILKMVQQYLSLVKDEAPIYGVDFDCEMIRNQGDYKNYINLIRVATEALHKDGYKVSVALHAGQFLPREVYKKLDRVNYMTYDLPDDPTNHAALEVIKPSVEQLIHSGCEPHRIQLGLPAYARHTKNPGNVKTFSELVDSATGSADDVDGVAQVMDKDIWQGYRYESSRSIQDKVSYALKMGLGGIFFWELGQDKQHAAVAPGGILLESAARAVAAASNVVVENNNKNKKNEQTSDDDDMIKQEL